MATGMELEDGGEFEYDLVTIGAGSGGVRASRVSAATYGAKVGAALRAFPPAIGADHVIDQRWLPVVVAPPSQPLPALSLQVAVVELPFGFVSSETVGGAGGTCVIRGCVPKKLLVYA